MGKVFSFNSRRRLTTYTEYAGAVKEEKNIERVQAYFDEVFGVRVNERNRIMVNEPRTAKLASPLPMGTLQAVSEPDNTVIIHEDYPLALENEQLSRGDAFALAVDSTIAYAALAKWASGFHHDQRVRFNRFKNKTDMLPSIPKFWESRDVQPTGEGQSSHVVLHRMAASLALVTSGVGEIDPVTAPPYPVHIAALADPFEIRQTQAIRHFVGL